MDNIDIVNQKIQEIEKLKIEIKKREDERLNIKNEVEAKKKEKESLENQIKELEHKRKDKINKLEKIKSLISGDENANQDFDIKPEEIFKYIPITPLDGIKEIENSLEELRDILNPENQIKSKDNNTFLLTINIRYGGDTLKYIIPQRSDYSFKHLLKDACEFFDKGDPKDYIFMDELNNIFPLHPGVREFLLKNPDFLLYLQEKGNKGKSQDREIMNLGSDTDKFKNWINNYLNKDDINHVKAEAIEENGQQDEFRKMLKVRKENDLLLMIEKTFGDKIIFLIFYLIFLGLILYMLITQNDVASHNSFYNSVNNEFYNSQFNFRFLVQDFLYDNDNETAYTVDLTLEEVNDVRILPQWFIDVYLTKLGFFTRKFEFIEKHKLIGKMRFLQIRSEDNSESCIRQNLNSTTTTTTNGNTTINGTSSNSTINSNNTVNINSTVNTNGTKSTNSTSGTSNITNTNSTKPASTNTTNPTNNTTTTNTTNTNTTNPANNTITPNNTNTKSRILSSTDTTNPANSTITQNNTNTNSTIPASTNITNPASTNNTNTPNSTNTNSTKPASTNTTNPANNNITTNSTNTNNTKPANNTVTPNNTNTIINTTTNTVISLGSTSNCYSENFNEETNDIKFNCVDMLKSFPSIKGWDKDSYLYMDSANNCQNKSSYNNISFTNPCSVKNGRMNNTFVCDILKQGTKHRSLSKIDFPQNGTNITEKFLYSGVLNQYSYDKAYYFDLDYNQVSSRDFNDTENLIRLTNFGNFVFRNWIDVNTRVIMISFICYQTIEEEDKIFTVSMFIEFSKTQAMKKIFKLSIYKRLIDFSNADLNKILRAFSYLLILFFYSCIFFLGNIKTLCKEKLSKILMDDSTFLLTLFMNSLIFAVFILRIFNLLLKNGYMAPYIKTGFVDYFPIDYYKSGLDTYINQLEVGMICLIIINTLNVFYFEFFARIFLTFKFAWKYIFAYLVIYFIIVIAYSASCNILYGSYISYFSSLTQSIITIVLLNYINMDIFNKMVYYYPFASRVIVFSYYFIFYFIVINMIFVILLKAYEKVKKKEPVSLLKFQLLGDGLINFIKNKLRLPD